MSRLDLVIFGATGFTGKHAVLEMTKLAKKHGLTWAVAGRSESKLQSLMLEISKKIGEDLSSIPVLVADVSHDKSLRVVCEQARVVVNCCGPYRLYGEPVVRAAIDTKTHYVDVSGEPQFIEMMQLSWDSAAREAGVFVVSACGFDSVPNDMGVAYMRQQFDGTLNSVESYLTTFLPPEHNDGGGVIHYGTWESLVHSLANYSELGPLRKKLYPDRLPNFNPKLKSRGIHSRFGKWCAPFLGADGSIVYRSQRHLHDTEHARPVQFKPYVKLGGLCSMLMSVVGGALLYLMCMTSFTRKILLDYPRLCSFGWVTRDGPSERVTTHTYYKFELFGEGWARGEDEAGTPTKKIAVKVSGVNPGYGATVDALLGCAITILKEKEKMPPHGGVMTTATAFAKTDLVKNLNEGSNMKFEVVDGDQRK